MSYKANLFTDIFRIDTAEIYDICNFPLDEEDYTEEQMKIHEFILENDELEIEVELTDYDDYGETCYGSIEFEDVIIDEKIFKPYATEFYEYACDYYQYEG